MILNIAVRLALVSAAALLTGCATSAFKAPLWPCAVGTDGKCIANNALSSSNAANVDAFLRANVSKYDGLLTDVETGKVVMEGPVLLAATFGPTAVALGASTDVAIGAAGIAGLGTGLSAWIKPRDRATYIVQARTATSCLLKEYNQLTRDASATSLASFTGNDRTYAAGANAKAYPLASAEVESAGRTALAASDEIVSKLKVRLAGVGTAPNYAAILDELKKQQDVSEKSFTSDQTKAAAFFSNNSSPPEEIVRRVSEYPVRVNLCAAMVQ